MEKYPFRAKLLAELESYTADDLVRKVEWASANDWVVCAVCARRNGQVYTLAEAKALLAGDYCRPKEEGQGCRCCFLPVIE